MGSKVASRNRGWYNLSLAGKLRSLPTGSKWHRRVPFDTEMLTVKGRQAQREPGNPSPAPQGPAPQLCSGPPGGEAFSRSHPSAGFLSGRKTAFVLQAAPAPGSPDAPEEAYQRDCPGPPWRGLRMGGRRGVGEDSSKTLEVKGQTISRLFPPSLAAPTPWDRVVSSLPSFCSSFCGHRDQTLAWHGMLPDPCQPGGKPL